MIANEKTLINLDYEITKSSEFVKEDGRKKATKGSVELFECTKCSRDDGQRIFKDRDSFHINHRTFLGISNTCKACKKKDEREKGKRIPNYMSTSEKKSIAMSTTLCFKIIKESGGFSIWYMKGDDFTYKKALDKLFTYRYQARNIINEDGLTREIEARLK